MHKPPVGGFSERSAAALAWKFSFDVFWYFLFSDFTEPKAGCERRRRGKWRWSQRGAPCPAQQWSWRVNDLAVSACPSRRRGGWEPTGWRLPQGGAAALWRAPQHPPALPTAGWPSWRRASWRGPWCLARGGRPGASALKPSSTSSWCSSMSARLPAWGGRKLYQSSLS